MELEDSPAPQQRPSRIIIVDDHPLFRSAIRHTLEVHHDLEVVAEAANGREALALCHRLRPELVLMDLRMPEMDGIAATHAIKRECPETLVLIFTAVDESAGLSDDCGSRYSPTQRDTRSAGHFVIPGRRADVVPIVQNE